MATQNGSLYQRGNVWWIKYYRNGIPMRESSGSDKESIAKSLLRSRLGDIEHGVPVTPKTNRVTFEELAADVVNDYKTNGHKSLDDVQRTFEMHLRPVFGDWRASNITTTKVREYVLARQDKGASNATINRELSALKRAFTLGMQAGKLTYRPHIPMLKENNIRKGFFEPAQFEALRAKLPAVLQPVVIFLYITGWRLSEALGLEWRQVDFTAGRVRLDAGTTKNGEAREFPFTAELRELLAQQREYVRQVERERATICKQVFIRPDGTPIKGFRKAWLRASRDAGCPGMIRHDFRRTAVRNLVRAGIPERVAMQMTGHKTRSVFERYNIVSDGDLSEAARKLDLAANKLTGTITGTGSR
jgi:integrase